jgi:hypothetical protein
MMAIVTPTVISSIAEAQAPRTQASAVLTSVNGQNLTQGMVNNAIAFYEFIVGEKFTSSEVSWFKEVIVKEFTNNPASTIQSHNTIAKFLLEIRQLNNPVARVQVREKLFTQLYLNELAKGTLNEPGVMTIVYKHSPVIAADPASKLVVTKRGIESYVEWYNFTAQLVGRPLVTNQEKAETTLYLQQNFRNIPLANRMMLAAAESHWLKLQQVWSSSSREYKLQKVAQLREIAKNKKASLPFSFINIALGSQIDRAWRNNEIPAIRQLPMLSDDIRR